MKTQSKKKAEALRTQVIQLFGTIAAGNGFAEAEAFSIGHRLTVELTAFDSFNQLLLAAGHGYRPTIRGDVDPRLTVLADLYDFFQARRGEPLRSYRAA